MNRRTFIKQSISFVLMGMFANYSTGEPKARTYKERVSSVLISGDGKHLVVMTREFHYIFNAPPVLFLSLKSSFHPYLSATFSKFHVASNGRVSGSVNLFLSQAPANALAEAVDSGFKITAQGAVFHAELDGNRYIAGPVPALARYKLNKTYEIEVVGEQAKHRASITPITIVKGVLAVAGVTLFALTILTSCALNGTLKNCHE